jgi:hypothetical protein
MTTFERLELERLRHQMGQRLRAADLADGVALEAQLRWWHTRALHDAYGVVEGLRVRTVPETPGRLVVERGLAYDAYGRELLLPADRAIPMPDDPRPQTLLARYRPTSRVPTSWEPEPSQPEGRPRVPECLALVWTPTARVRPTADDGVPLARLRAADGDAGGDGDGGRLDPTVRVPVARPLARPRIASGSTPPYGTAWEPWQAGGRILGIQATIDTSAAGFTQTPCYLVRLDGSHPLPRGEVVSPSEGAGRDALSPYQRHRSGGPARRAPVRLERRHGAAGSPDTAYVGHRATHRFWGIAQDALPAPWSGLVVEHVVRPTSVGFTVRVWVPTPMTPLAFTGLGIRLHRLGAPLLALAREHGLGVAWVGIEGWPRSSADPSSVAQPSTGGPHA